MLQEHGIGEGTGIGGLLGWGMAAIYMGGRLPQILLNVRLFHSKRLINYLFIYQEQC